LPPKLTRRSWTGSPPQPISCRNKNAGCRDARGRECASQHAQLPGRGLNSLRSRCPSRSRCLNPARCRSQSRQSRSLPRLRLPKPLNHPRQRQMRHGPLHRQECPPPNRHCLHVYLLHRCHPL
jgi:hypothetical protein